jgi:hypothetical protein
VINRADFDVTTGSLAPYRVTDYLLITKATTALDPAHGKKDLRLEICSHARQESHYSRSHAGPLHSNLLQMQVNVRFDPQPNSTCFAPRQQAKIDMA